MSFEPLYIESWIYSTLHGDSTLTDALADVTGEAPGYQQGVYLHMAPERDRVSGKPPAVPYIVVTRAGSGSAYERGLCGERVLSRPIYRVTVWDSQNGAVAMDRVIDVADRVDALLDGQGDDGPPKFIGWRVDDDEVTDPQYGGETLYGAVLVFEYETGV